MRAQIILHNATEKDCWEATFVGDEELVALFGTTTIPTPHRSSASASFVKSRIEKRNPGCEVVVH